MTDSDSSFISEQALERWLQQATSGLSQDSASRVRTEIQQHFESAREVEIAGGVAPVEAGSRALAALGNPKTANRQYRRVLLTVAEARMLRQSNWEARAVCSRPWLKVLMAFFPMAAAILAGVLHHAGIWSTAGSWIVAGSGIGLYLAIFFLPIYTFRRSRVFRVVKWALFADVLLVAFGPHALRMLWLLACIAWPFLWTEIVRASIRKKLPIGEWPKQLYL